MIRYNHSMYRKSIQRLNITQTQPQLVITQTTYGLPIMTHKLARQRMLDNLLDLQHHKMVQMAKQSEQMHPFTATMEITLMLKRQTGLMRAKTQVIQDFLK